MHDLRINCHRQVNGEAWDANLLALRGSYFHCHAQALYEATFPGTSPLFLEAFAGRTLVGVAAVSLRSPKAPLLSRLCREASFAALPSTIPADASTEQEVLAAFEKRLRQIGVFRFHVHSQTSPNSDAVLKSLDYVSLPRYEFYLQLSKTVDDNWGALRNERRKKVRKAINGGLEVLEASDRNGVHELLKLNCDALSRKGVHSSLNEYRIESMLHYLLDTSRAVLLVCFRESTPLGALLFGIFGNQACTLLSGTSLEGNQYGARVLLHWKMIELLTSRQVDRVNLGAVTIQPDEEPSQNGLYTFKKDFGAMAVRQSSGVKTLPGAARLLSDFRDWYRNQWEIIPLE